MAAKGRNLYLKGEGIGTRELHVSIAEHEDIFALLQALNNWDIPPIVPLNHDIHSTSRFSS